MNKDTFYFSHDYNARNDDKIKKLIRKHGMQGYGVYWSIVEELYNNANALRTDYNGIAYDLRTDENLVKSVIIDFDLFVFDDAYFGSKSIERRLNDRNHKSIKARESANKRWENMRTQSDGNANASKNDAIKERKGKERKVFIIPNIFEIENYFLENGYSQESAHRFFKYYNSGDWIDSKNHKVNNWKQKAQAVWFKDENKIKSEPEMIKVAR